MKFFNTAGPVNQPDHYLLDPLKRLDLENLLILIEQKKYFVLHAPRQTGKTSCLLALRDYLNARNQYRCVYVNVEIAQAAREDVGAAMQAILAALGDWARDGSNDQYPEKIWSGILKEHGHHQAFEATLAAWASQSPLPLILLFDEVDALIGDTLISFLRQLRAGYNKRPLQFPQSVILCGVRDVRDYRINSYSTKEIITGGSAFNIKARSLRIGNFTAQEIAELYAEHTKATGQIFTDAALIRAWELTRGQPWLVNALAYETCFEFKAGQKRNEPITVELLNEAKEVLIIRRETHLDQLADKLQEERVRKVIEPILSGTIHPELIPPDDLDYVLDLGLIDKINGQLAIANAIYREVLPRQLTYSTTLTISQEQRWYIMHNGKLDDIKLIAAFQEFFRENSEHWLNNVAYVEAAPQLLMQAFLQRIVNGGGFIEREYGLGRGRTDLMIIWKYPDGVQKIVIELKVLRKSLEKTINDGLAQTYEYLDRMEQSNGHLIIFDRSNKSWEEKIFRRDELYHGRNIIIWGM